MNGPEHGRRGNDPVFHRAPEAIMLLDPASLRITWANLAATRLYGRPQVEFVGACPFTLGPAVQFGADALERAREVVAGVMAGGACAVTEWIHERLDGERFAVELHLCTWPDPEGGPEPVLRAVAFDVTARRMAERRMRLLSRVFADAQQGMIIADETDQPLLTNQAFHAITGLPDPVPAHAFGALFASPVNPASALELQQRELDVRGQWKGQWWIRRADGRDVPVLLHITRVAGTPPEPGRTVTVLTDISRVLETEEQLDRMTYQDLMTGLANRRRALELLEARVAHEMPTALLHVDMDDFKDVNDGLGHQAGDHLLRAVAERLQGAVRAADTVARIHGDEFFVIAPLQGGEGAAERLAARVLDTLRAPFPLQERRIFLTASVGIGLFPAHGEDVESLVHHADAAKHRAKAEGGDRLAMFTPTLIRLANRRLALLDTLRRALEDGQIVPYFQPQVHAHTGQVLGLEALARWEHPDEGTLSPARFLPVLEQSPLMEQFTRTVLLAAGKAVAAWRASGLFTGRLAMNLSGGQIATGTVPLVLDTIAKAGLPEAALELEITETSIIHRANEAAQVLGVLRGRGIQIAIDDFGTGYSSLQHLKVLPVDALKIDRTFVAGLPDDAGDRTLTGAVIALGRALRKTVVAEGVETDAQADFLRQQGCDVLQGFGIARPMPAEKTATWLRSWRGWTPALSGEDTEADDEPAST